MYVFRAEHSDIMPTSYMPQNLAKWLDWADLHSRLPKTFKFSTTEAVLRETVAWGHIVLPRCLLRVHCKTVVLVWEPFRRDR